MKASAVAVAAILGQASATFHNAPPFSCPGNTNNHCLPEYSSGLNWQGLNPGSFTKYKGFIWSGFTAANSFGKRSDLVPRNFQNKCITGKAQQSGGSNPNMSCDTSVGNDQMSISEIQIVVEFDCDLEFHYSMPGGSTCKERHSCSSAGTTVSNSQCGGATGVTVVYPPQPHIPKSGCGFAIPSIGFNCSDNTPPPTSTKPPVSLPTSSTHGYTTLPPVVTSSVKTTSSSAAITTSSRPVGDTYTASVPGTTLSTAPATTSSAPAGTTSTPVDTYSVTVPGGTTSTPAGTTSSPADTTSTPAGTTSTPVDTYSVTVPGGTTSSPAGTVSSPAGTVSSPAGTVSTPAGTVSSPAGTVSTPAGTDSLSTPAGTYSVTLPGGAGSSSSSVPVVGTTSSPAGPGNTYSVTVPGQSTTASTLPATGSSSVPAVGSTSSAPGTPSGPAGTPSGTTTAPADTASAPGPSAPVETLPCPSVVPSCLNTWMFVVNCIDNTDSSCYCPDANFVTNVFNCMYAYGESDDIIQEAVQYFQGICAPYAPQNPAIGTGAETITQVLTVTQTTPPTGVYTTIQITATSVVPCTDAQGSTIPSSSSTITYSTTVSVPEVQFTTITNQPGTTQVGIIPGAPTVYPTATAPAGPTATATFSAPANGGGSGSGNGAGPTTLVTSAPGSYPTGGVLPSATPSIPIAAAGRVGGSVFAGVAAFIAAVFVL